MADPTLADVMAALNALRSDVVFVKLQNTQQTALLSSLVTGEQLMSATANQTAAAVTALDAKVDQFLALVAPQIATLQQSLATAQALIAQLQAGDAAAAVTLGTTVDSAVAETAKVQAAIDALTPPAPAP